MFYVIFKGCQHRAQWWSSLSFRLCIGTSTRCWMHLCWLPEQQWGSICFIDASSVHQSWARFSAPIGLWWCHSGWHTFAFHRHTQWSLTLLSRLVLPWFDWPLTPLLLLARHNPPSIGVSSFAPVLYSLGVGVPMVEDVEKMHLVALGTNTFR